MTTPSIPRKSPLHCAASCGKLVTMPEALLVEDSPVQALLVKRALQAAGYTVEHATTAEQALKTCYNSPPDIVLQDQHLAEMSGLEVCRRIKNDIVLSNIPVLALTAGNREKEHIAALDAGADAFLPKDSPGEQLLAVMARLIAIAAAERSNNLTGQAQELLKRTRILVIDDSATYRKTLSKKLVESGFEIADAASGPEGLSLLGEQTFDVVVVDLVMPEMDGLAFCQRARKWADEHHQHLGLLVLTGSDREDVLVSALDAGADDYVSKMHEMDVTLAHVTAVARRVTRAKQVEAINQRSDGQPTSGFAAEISDEFHESIKRIISTSEALSQSKLTAKQRDQLKTIEESAGTLLQLLRPEENDAEGAPASAPDVATQLADGETGEDEDPAELLDWDEVKQRVPDEIINDVAEMLLSECQTLLAQIREGLESGSADKVRLGAHTLKGSAAVFVADRVVEASARLELMGKNNDLTGGKEALAVLEKEVDRLLEAIRARG